MKDLAPSETSKACGRDMAIRDISPAVHDLLKICDHNMAQRCEICYEDPVSQL